MSEVVLQLDGLTKRYGALTSVDDLSLSVNEGEIFGFLGPNGAGKTTAISMMCGLLKPTAGRVLVDGRPIQGGGAGVRARVGVCPQDTILWEKLTCLEQLEYIGEMYGVPRQTARQRGGELLEALGLAAKANVTAGKLSGGMKRRLNLALALVHDPAIVVLDEPEAGLDPQSRVLVRDYVRTLARRKTVILTTHNMDEADRLADRVAIIDHGRLLALDTPAAIKQSIGQGDVLELELPADPAAAQACLAPFGLEISTLNHTLLLRGRHLIERLPDLLTALRTANHPPVEIRLRPNTLEDAFIALTGRRLRE
jgi:ABC-2 type transport system ATP-binding protein